MNRLQLDFSLESNQERKEFLDKYKLSIKEHYKIIIKIQLVYLKIG